MTDGAFPDALPTGHRLHWYVIEQVLGQGGFGITYLAHDPNLDRRVAIKEYMPSEVARRRADASARPRTGTQAERYAWGLERFLSEARTLARFDHPNIVRVHSVFEANNTAYMVMRFEEGEDLASLLERRGALPEGELNNCLMPILDGLELVHASGFIHRDIKPENIYVRQDGSPVLLDFGSARQSFGSAKTMTILVAPGYAPLEQYHGDATSQGPWTDIYGLGATCYRAITGHAPLDSVARAKGVLGSFPRDPAVGARGRTRPLSRAAARGGGPRAATERARPTAADRRLAARDRRHSPPGGRLAGDCGPVVRASCLGRHDGKEGWAVDATRRPAMGCGDRRLCDGRSRDLLSRPATQHAAGRAECGDADHRAYHPGAVADGAAGNRDLDVRFGNVAAHRLGARCGSPGGRCRRVRRACGRGLEHHFQPATPTVVRKAAVAPARSPDSTPSTTRTVSPPTQGAPAPASPAAQTSPPPAPLATVATATTQPEPVRDHTAARQQHDESLEAAESALRRGDAVAAAKILTPLAAAGVPRAQTLLGRAREARGGGQRSDFEAYVWYGIAARNGDPSAPGLKEKVAPRLQPAEILQAEKIVKGWKPGAEPASGCRLVTSRATILLTIALALTGCASDQQKISAINAVNEGFSGRVRKAPRREGRARLPAKPRRCLRVDARRPRRTRHEDRAAGPVPRPPGSGGEGTAAADRRRMAACL
jgi:hypothetical protein